MENTEEIRKKISRLIKDRGLNYAQVSLAIGKNIAYIQQFIKNGSPRRLGEVERHKLAAILRVDEQELTDLSLNATPSVRASVNSEYLGTLIENVEQWLANRNLALSPHDKAELIKATSAHTSVNSEILGTVIENIEEWIVHRGVALSAHDKAELVKLIYMKVCNDTTSVAASKVKDFIEVYNELQKVN